MDLRDRAIEYYGIAHSLRRYYAPSHTRRLVDVYARFIRPGDLCFDIGAHVGSRVRAWLRLGARVVAVEPQPLCVRVLRACYGRNPAVTVVDRALGAAPGELELRVSRRSPGISTASDAWISTLQRRRRDFARERWDTTVRVPVTTLDALIARFGEPAFVKIDVEGFEEQVLAGLRRPLPSLSFEYIPAAWESALACLERLQMLGSYRFNISPGEAEGFVLADWADAETVATWIVAQPPEATPGDIYARLISIPGARADGAPTATTRKRQPHAPREAAAPLPAR